MSRLLLLAGFGSALALGGCAFDDVKPPTPAPPPPKALIRVDNAWWGIVASAHDVTPAAQAKCGGKETCDVEASNAWVGYDPFPGRQKKLWITYSCVRNGQVLRTTSFDNDEFTPPIVVKATCEGL